MLSFPLNSNRQPITKQRSTGRFIVEMEGFLEPRDFPLGTAITVKGNYVGLVDGKIGGASYRYPLLQGEQLDVWEPEPADTGTKQPRVRWSIGIGTGGSGIGVGIGL